MRGRGHRVRDEVTTKGEANERKEGREEGREGEHDDKEMRREIGVGERTIGRYKELARR